MYGSIVWGATPWGITSVQSGPVYLEATGAFDVDVVPAPLASAMLSASAAAGASIELIAAGESKQFLSAAAVSINAVDLAPVGVVLMSSTGLLDIELEIVTDVAILAGASIAVFDADVTLQPQGAVIYSGAGQAGADVRWATSATSVIGASGRLTQSTDLFGEAKVLIAALGSLDISVDTIGAATRRMAVVLPDNPLDATMVRLGNYLYVWRAEQVRWRPFGPAP